MRAMSVRVNDVIGVAGFIVPGSRVDVVVTIRRERGQHDAHRRQQRPGAHRRHAPGPGEAAERDIRISRTRRTVVTLMVSPGDAERIALAQSEGQIMLVLRNPLDHETTVDVRRQDGGAARSETDAAASAPAPVVGRARRAASRRSPAGSRAEAGPRRRRRAPSKRSARRSAPKR